MSKIFLNGKVIWDKSHLPDEKESMKLLATYIKDEINPEVVIALSCGIETWCNGLHFVALLNNEMEDE
jgi:hypothetical protein